MRNLLHLVVIVLLIVGMIALAKLFFFREELFHKQSYVHPHQSKDSFGAPFQAIQDVLGTAPQDVFVNKNCYLIIKKNPQGDIIDFSSYIQWYFAGDTRPANPAFNHPDIWLRCPHPDPKSDHVISNDISLEQAGVVGLELQRNNNAVIVQGKLANGETISLAIRPPAMK